MSGLKKRNIKLYMSEGNVKRNYNYLHWLVGGACIQKWRYVDIRRMCML